MPAGALPTCCPTSARPRTSSAARTNFTATGGPLAVSDMEPLPICDAFIAAAEQCGYRAQSGFQRRRAGRLRLLPAHHAQRAALLGRRSAISSPRGGAPNLKVVSQALATRVLFEGRRATGVEYLQGDTKHTRAHAREVILSGGTFNSPQLMQLSGLGPAALLREHGIAVIADMPGVGADLQDHFHARMVFRCTQPVSVNDCSPASWRGLDGRAALRAAPARPARDGRGLCGRLLAHQRGRRDARRAVPHHAVLRRHDRRRRCIRSPASPCPLIVLRPESRGTVRIKSADPRAAARDPAALSLRRRRIATRWSPACARCAASWRRPPIAPFIEAEHEPGPACASDDDLLDYVRRRGSTVYHPTSTCRMGDDPTAVVDARLQACAASSGCASSMPRSCPRSSPATPTRRRS